jgi:predicted CXXCH cytochrome family protein
MPADPSQTRPARIALDYFKQGDSLRRWKLMLTIAATVAALVWILSGILRSDGGWLRYSRGPVASVHAMWDAQCDFCHSSFRPIQSDAWAAAIVGTAGDAKCQHCHEGPPHHASAASPACATCHREHQGREASLIQLADAVCVQCHGSLPAHTFSSKYTENITRFDLDHPQFQIDDPVSRARTPIDRAIDPGRLKFNHKRHLAEGIKLEGGEPLLRDAKGNPVQLECATCHQLDAQISSASEPIPGLPTAVSPPRAAAASMLPIVYEKHCKSCHPITFDKGQMEVPHRMQPNELHGFLERHYAARLLKANPSLFDKKLPARLIPGKTPDPKLEEAMTNIRSQIAGAESVLYKSQDKKTCGECHPYDDGKQNIISPNVPTVWLPHARFSHLAHRAVDCASCHPRAYDSTQANEILLPGIEVCKKCHAPAANNSGGARTNCTECHKYHNGDAPLQGIGAEERKPRKMHRIDELLP